MISPHTVALYDVKREGEERDVYEYSVNTEDFLNFLGTQSTNTDTPWYRFATRLGDRRQALGTVTAAAAISGAAVTSAMGRSSLGTTNALVDALNVRLGTWLPNPRYVERQANKPNHPTPARSTGSTTSSRRFWEATTSKSRSST